MLLDYFCLLALIHKTLTLPVRGNIPLLPLKAAHTPLFSQFQTDVDEAVWFQFLCSPQNWHTDGAPQA